MYNDHIDGALWGPRKGLVVVPGLHPEPLTQHHCQGLIDSIPAYLRPPVGQVGCSNVGDRLQAGHQRSQLAGMLAKVTVGGKRAVNVI